MFLLFTALCFAAGAAMVASKRGSPNTVGWFFLGLFLGPIGFGFSFLAGSGRRCPQCAESVRPEAVKCRYCGSPLPPPVLPVKEIPRQMKPAVKLVLGTALFLMVITLIWFSMRHSA